MDIEDIFIGVQVIIFSIGFLCGLILLCPRQLLGLHCQIF